MLFIRQGKVLGSRSYFPKVPADTPLEEVVQSFLLQFYLSGQGRQIPSEVLLDVALEDESVIADTLSQTAGCRARVVSRRAANGRVSSSSPPSTPQTALRSRLAHKSTITARYDPAGGAAGARDPIARMECFDISPHHGERTVASCVVFKPGGPLSSEYRRFNIDGITGGDDYAAMEQALERRFGKQQEPDKVPDVLFIDGGLGQLRPRRGDTGAPAGFLGGKYPAPGGHRQG